MTTLTSGSAGFDWPFGRTVVEPDSAFEEVREDQASRPAAIIAAASPAPGSSKIDQCSPANVDTSTPSVASRLQPRLESTSHPVGRSWQTKTCARPSKAFGL